MAGSGVTPQARGLAAIRQALADLADLPPYEVSPDDYRDWGGEGEFRVKVGQGECAG